MQPEYVVIRTRRGPHERADFYAPHDSIAWAGTLAEARVLDQAAAETVAARWQKRDPGANVRAVSLEDARLEDFLCRAADAAFAAIREIARAEHRPDDVEWAIDAAVHGLVMGRLEDGGADENDPRIDQVTDLLAAFGAEARARAELAEAECRLKGVR